MKSLQKINLVSNELLPIEKNASTRVRDYRKEYLRDHAHKEAKNNRVKRNYWNRKIKTPPGKEIDHKVPLSKGGGNGRANLRVTSVSANRAKGEKIAGSLGAMAGHLNAHALNAYLISKEKNKIRKYTQEELDRVRSARAQVYNYARWRKNTPT